MFRPIIQFSVEFTEDAEETVLLETELIREWKTQNQPENESPRILILY